MVKQVIQNLLFLTVGLIVGYFVGCSGKNVNVVNDTKVVIEIDTFVHEVEVPIVKKETEYITINNTLLETTTDTLYVSLFPPDSIPVNVYKDTLNTNDYSFIYEAKTLGELLSLKSTITTYNKTETIYEPLYKYPKWMISGAISNRGNYKVGLGYKGWTVEAELNNNLNQVFFGYQYKF